MLRRTTLLTGEPNGVASVSTNKKVSKQSGSRRIILFAGCLVVAIAPLYWWGERRGPEPAHAATAAVPSVAVSAASAARHDVPIFVSGLGTVQAVATVAIRSQVDGKIQEVLFTEGQRVKKGDVLVKIDPRLFQAALDQAKAKKAQDEAQLISAQKDLDRFSALVAKSFASQQNVDQQQAKVDQLKASIVADDGAIESAQTQLDYTIITAPTDGRVGVRQVDAGNIVHASDQASLVVLTQNQPSTALFTLPARLLEDVRDAMKRGSVEVLAYDQDDKRLLSKGSLLLVDNIIDQATATIRLKAIFANEDDALWSGEFVNIHVLLDTKHDVLTIPSIAVQRGPDGLYAWVVTGQGTAEIRPLKVGPTADKLTIVESGLEEGERVITDGHYKLRQKIPVTITSPRVAGNGDLS
jgi:membrane fusion protein, multidrug efflux system